MGSTVDGRIPYVATLNIKDPEVYRLARELADRRQTSMTAAIRAALNEALASAAADREGLADRLLEIGRRAAAKPGPWLTEADLYDEDGLPR
jgi:antitoxin VapB